MNHPQTPTGKGVAFLTIEPSNLLGDSFVVVLVQKFCFLKILSILFGFVSNQITGNWGGGKTLIRALAPNVAQMVKNQGSIPGLGRSSGGGNGNPLQ